MKKAKRKKVFEKYDGHCAYCGVKMNYQAMQVDHIEPMKRGEKDYFIEGVNDMPNLNPSCRRCNRWKSDWSLETFRREVQLQLVRLRRDSSNYRIALDYGLIKEVIEPVEFYFEKTNNKG